jgi:hypothetical protein
MPAKWQRFTIDIPKGYSPAEREVIAEEIIDFIRERSAKGLNKNNREFPGYSEEYEKSLNFKIAGKSKDKVDLTLSGDMLGALSLLSDSNGKIMIGFENGTEENAIADGNIRGTYGKSKPSSKKRDFLGITKADLAKILDDHPLEESDSADAISRASKKAKTVTDSVSDGVEEGSDGE